MSPQTEREQQERAERIEEEAKLLMAVGSILDVLRPLTRDARIRVLRASCTLLDIRFEMYE